MYAGREGKTCIYVRRRSGPKFYISLCERDGIMRNGVQGNERAHRVEPPRSARRAMSFFDDCLTSLM